jgi:hypothetical protein
MSVDVSGGTTGLTTSGGPITGSGTITLGGTLAVANGGTGVTTSTGTGSVVLSDSPTLVTPILGAASATSIANALGTVGAPSYTFAGDTNTGMWSPAADTIAFSEGGVEAMRIDSSGNVGIGTSSPSAILNVYSATGAFIDLFGDAGTTISAVRSSTDATGANLVLRKARGTTASRTAVASGDTIGTLFFSAFGGTSNRNIASIVGTVGTYTSDADISSNLIFNTTPTGSASPAERMRVTSAGNVGIGTTNPGARLQINSQDGFRFDVEAGAASTMRFGSAFAGESTGALAWVRSAGAMTFSSGATGSALTERMRIDPSGNVGIGTTSPGQRLTVAGVIESTTGGVRFPDGTTQTTAASGGATLTAVASGSLSDGSTVVVNTDGTVSVVAAVTQAVGSPTVFRATDSPQISATYDSVAQRVVIAYQDVNNSSFGTAIAGTVSGTGISFGTPVVFRSGFARYMSATYDSAAQRVVIAYADGGTGGFVVAGQVSGNSITFGNEVMFRQEPISESSGTSISTVYDSNAQRVIIVSRDEPGNGQARVAQVIGNSFNLGNPVGFTFANANNAFFSATYDSAAQRVVIAFRDGGNSLFGTAVVGTVSGNSISFGAPVVFHSSFTDFVSATYDSAAQRVVIAYRDISPNIGKARVGTVSGNSISFGTEVAFWSGGLRNISATYDSAAQRVVIAYTNVGNSSFGTAIVGTVSGNSISFGVPVVFEGASTDFISATYDSAAQRVVIAYRDVGNNNAGTAVVFRNAGTNLTAQNFIGFSNAAFTNGQAATIQIAGSVDDAQSGLIPGRSYFVQGNGTLGLTPGTPSVFAGTAVAANRIIVKG